jgi:NAD(P)H-nitrite reductase large subunit
VTAERLVVVGGGPAALEAVRAYREEGADGEVVLVCADEYLPYNRPPLSKDFCSASRKRTSCLSKTGLLSPARH